MNEPLLCWCWLIIVASWRRLMHVDRFEKKVGALCRPALDRYGLAPVLQWYFLACAGTLLGLFWAFQSILVYDWGKMDLLRSPEIEKQLEAHGQDPAKLHIWEWLRWMALLAPCVGLIACCIIGNHVYSYAHARAKERAEERSRMQAGDVVLTIHSRVRERGTLGRCGTIIAEDAGDQLPYKVRFEEDGSANWLAPDKIELVIEDGDPWMMDFTEDLTLMVIIMPGVFIAMALWAEIRALQVLTGSSIREGDTWQAFTLWRRCTYQEDLECAVAFQYFTVYAFAMICSRFFGLEGLATEVEREEKRLVMENNRLRSSRSEGSGASLESSLRPQLNKASQEHSNSLKWAGLQGVWAYIAVGFARSLLFFGSAVLKELKQDAVVANVHVVLETISPVFVFVTFLCIYNMIVIFWLEEIKDKRALGRWASVKFIGTRVLLMLPDGQMAVLSTLSHYSRGAVGPEQVLLVHVVLLVFECLAVVVWNRFMWAEKVQRLEGYYKMSSQSSF